MKPALPRRVAALEERVPLKRAGGPMIVILEDGADQHGPFQPWFDHRGQPHEPIIVVEDLRPATTPVFIGDDRLHECSAPEDAYDYGDEEPE